MTSQAIQTLYRGYRFRSRLEARWAVFFDTLGIKYEYEPEGFELDGGRRYLPDFFLPVQKLWVEIKPSAPNRDELSKAEGLVFAREEPVFISHGMPDAGGTLVCIRFSFEREVNVFGGEVTSSIWEPRDVAFHEFDETAPRYRKGADAWLNEMPFCAPGVSLIRSSSRLRPLGKNNTEALHAARGARFEFGEQGA